MDYTLIILTPDDGRVAIALASYVQVQEHIVKFLENTHEENFTIQLVHNP